MLNQSTIIQEHSSSSYSPRTYFNAKSADLTIAFAVNLKTAGELLTHKAAGNKYLGFQLTEDTDSFDLAEKILQRIQTDKVKTINIAGNGIYTLSQHGYAQEFINEFIFVVLSQVHNTIHIEKLFTGGQTGVDLAGAVAGNCLSIPTLVTLPKGYIQRFENKEDIIQEKFMIENQISTFSQKILEKYQNKQNKLTY